MRTLTQKTDAFQSLAARYNNSSHSQKPAPGRSIIYGAILHSSTGKYALVQGRLTGKWSFPKGHVNRFETPFECVGREAAEEVGVDSLPSPQRGIPLRIGYYYLFETASEITLSPRDSKEVVQAGWFSPEEMRNMNLNIDASTFVKAM